MKLRSPIVALALAFFLNFAGLLSAQSVTVLPPVANGVTAQNSNGQVNAIQEIAPTNWTEIALFVVAVAQAIIYARQAYLMRKTIETSKVSSERQLRAYVHPTRQDTDDIKIIDESGNAEFYIRIKNAGQTPAYIHTKFNRALPDERGCGEFLGLTGTSGTEAGKPLKCLVRCRRNFTLETREGS